MSFGTIVSARRSLRYWAPLMALAVVMTAVTGVLVLGWMIQTGAHENGRAAMREFGGDEVEALIAFVQSDRHPLRERNRAVWALGQLGDRRALPVLEKPYTGAPCQHDRFLCQRELGKAIVLCKGKRNITKIAWRLLSPEDQSDEESEARGRIVARVTPSRSRARGPGARPPRPPGGAARR
jgi:hypothetical protein